MTTILELIQEVNDTMTGYTVNGNSVSIDLDDTSFSSLQSRGWMNFRQQKCFFLNLIHHIELLQIAVLMPDQEMLGLIMILKRGLFALATVTPTLLIVPLQDQLMTYWNVTILA